MTMATILGEGTIQELRESIRGEVIAPADAGYDQARAVWNGMIDKRPALIVRCAGVADVLAAVQFGRSQDLEIAVRGGGHSLPGFSTTDGGIVIDLSPMKGVRIDPEAQRVVAQAGLTWRELDHETQAFGLAVTGGLVSSTGIAGFTLGGGIGWLMRKHGLAADNLVAADLVTADGRLVHASEHENPELLWGLRGGGGNFGIVTSFEFRLHRVGPTILAGPIFFPGEQATQVLRGYREYTASLPDEMTTLVNLLTAPPAPFLPADVHGKPVVAVVAVYAGQPDDGRRLAMPLRELGTPIADLLGPMPYTTMQSLLDGFYSPGARNYFKSAYLGGLSDEVIDTLARFHGPSSSPASEIHVQHLGGALSRVAEDATAFGGRSAPYILNVVARWAEAGTDAAQLSWARDLHAAVEPFTTGGAYVNFLSAGEDRVAAAYSPATYERLARLKDTWDPTNVFRLNQNISPAQRVNA
jgi:FAD/FMN-containing dehydrogenase